MDDTMPAGAVCGPDGCDTETATAASLPTDKSVGTRIDIVSDAICPWCYVGKRQLERALTILEGEGLRFSVHWNPFQLNPDMPKEGRDRTAYRVWKFGSAEKAAALDERITQAAAGVGLAFRTDLMTRTPNTIDAHRLIWFAGRNGIQDAAMEAVFKAYFTAGRDIGDHAVLADCAAEAGLDRAEATAFLTGDLADKEMRAADHAARQAGVNGVPSFFLDGYGLFSGAMPAETIADALRRGREVLLKQQA
ncbi:MAG TPA: DsbA family oxidoreductase [Acetobacteraceae bacterium]|nr:DsbA family oxidoreductase [Acetobacteraceae bacterium]